ncbi:T9SS type A sorting domain-containing protein [Flavihumibacter fluvii]|uniref:T9SS type A sorting domain-containing protein n=1 Tax=Flavihumibacter fluvii TaxID=2838157 RepID=UPI001BDEA1F6|nr:T9SS type A sorting domain-containing protein [Flavihumibacter fluvii]ULQ51559.1 T9SS type A sorting domain-containing protein [Flavihumibacter fluvii]
MKNRITWTTAETVETKIYEVQRSSDGINFKTIGSVTVSSQNFTNYMFEDEHPLPVGYYQICSISSLGKKTYSAKIKAISTGGNIVIRQGYNTTTLLFKDNTPRDIILVNTNGQKISRTTTTLNQHTFHTSALSKGMYLVVIHAEGGSDIQKIMVL